MSGEDVSTCAVAGVTLLELVACRLHDRTGDDLGLIELPTGWELASGDLLCDERGHLVRVVDLVPCTSPPSRIAALVKVELAAERAPWCPEIF